MLGLVLDLMLGLVLGLALGLGLGIIVCVCVGVVLRLHVTAAEHDAGLHTHVDLPASHARQHSRLPRQGSIHTYIHAP